jgi:hypothetical protein
MSSPRRGVVSLSSGASGEGPRGHEILYHATVPELVLDGIGMVRTSILQELLEVIHGRSRLTLATTYGDHDAHHVGATHLLVVASVLTDHGHGLLTTLLVLLLSAHGAILSILDDDAGRCFSTAARGQVKLSCLIADGALGGNAGQLLGGVLDSVDRCLKRSYQRHVTCTGLTMALVPHPHDGPARRAVGSTCGPHHHSKAWLEKSFGSGGAALVMDDVMSGPCQLVLA